jgi:pyruvate carboxylase
MSRTRPRTSPSRIPCLDDARRSRPAAWRLAEGIQEEGAEGREAYTERPGSLLPKMRISKRTQGRSRTKLERTSENEFASYLMYPKVFTDFAQSAAQTYGPVSVLPTPVYFYGLPNQATSSSSRSRRARRW